MKYNMPIYISLLLPLVGVIACEHGNSIRPMSLSSLETDSSQPMVILMRYPGYTLSEKRLISGLIVAAWQDGRIIRVADERKVGQTDAYISGCLTKENVNQLITMVKACLSVEQPSETWLIVDAARERLYLRYDDKVADIEESVPSVYDSQIAPIKSLLISSDLKQVVALDGIPNIKGSESEQRGHQ